MKKVLITGGAGFIGLNLVKKLLSKNYDITVLDNLSSQIHQIQNINESEYYKSVFSKVNFIEGNVKSIKDIKNAINNQEIIIHLASETGTGQSMYDIKNYTEVNILGTSLIIDYLTNNKNHVEKFIIASSRSIYGEGKYIDNKNNIVFPSSRKNDDMKKGIFNPSYRDNYEIKPLATCEESKIQPSSIYAISKQFQEQLVMIQCPNINIAPISLRFQNVYGPGQSLKNPYTGILSIFSNLIINNKQVNIFEDGNETRDFIFIDDVIDAIYLSIVSDDANFDIFNVGSGKMSSVLDVTKLLYKFLGFEENFKISGDYRLGDIRHNYADISKISSILGFNPNVSLETGIMLFCEWVKTQKIPHLNYLESINELKNKKLFCD